MSIVELVRTADGGIQVDNDQILCVGEVCNLQHFRRSARLEGVKLPLHDHRMGAIIEVQALVLK